MSGLSDVPWLNSAALQAVVKALESSGSPVRIVGGAVRDGLLGLPVADIDLATPLLPAEVAKRLETAGFKAIPTGIDHGTITAVASGKSFEITTLRRDVSTDGRRATVAFSTDWNEDAARRDFTINALYADPHSGEVFDYFGGLDDLSAGLVRFIGDAQTRIAEDHLRILRFFRFYARFGNAAPDATAIEACRNAANSLMALSRERIADELIKLLSLPAPGRSVQLMIEHGIFKAFLPEVSPETAPEFERLLAREKQVQATIVAGRRLNALLPKDAQIAENIAARLKLSNRMRSETCARLAMTTPKSACARAYGYRLGVPIASDLFLLHGSDSDWLKGFEQLQGWVPPQLPIKGGDLIKMGLAAGPDVAKLLSQIEQNWIDEGFPNAERTIAIAGQLVGAKLSDKKE